MKKLGFGCMRLPMMGGADGEVDKREFCRMVDTFLAEGFCYFDTAHGYLNGKSETALRECLTARYPRESYILTDKLTSFFFEKEDDILPLFDQQLEKTGVSYFDYYLLHALNGAYYEKFTRCNAFEIVKQLKEQGRVKHIGISFHDKPALLDRVLDEHPEIEVVQIQFNYADYENPSIESRAVYEVCRRHQKPVIVMEPVKGGGLIQLPEEAKELSIPEAMDEMIRWFCILFGNQFTPDDVLDYYPVDRLMHDIALALMAVQTQTTSILDEFPTKAAQAENGAEQPQTQTA